MKVYDLCCPAQHHFEGWFGSAADFDTQLARSLIACPICNSSQIEKRPSAPRLNLSGAKAPQESGPGRDRVSQGNSSANPSGQPTATAGGQQISPAPDGAGPSPQQIQAAMLELARQVLARTEDVGEQFADEARRIHYNEAPERAIRGVATPDERAELLDEGIEIFPLAIPAALKETLQ